MAEYRYHYARAVAQAHFGKEARGPIVKAILHWRKSGDKLRIMYTYAIENHQEKQMKKLDTRLPPMWRRFNERVNRVSTTALGGEYYRLEFTRANGK